MRIGWSVPLLGPFRVSGNVGLPRGYRRGTAQKNRDAARRAAWKAERAAERRAARERQIREGITWDELVKEWLALLFFAWLFWGWLRPVSIVCLLLVPVAFWAARSNNSAVETVATDGGVKGTAS